MVGDGVVVRSFVCSFAFVLVCLFVCLLFLLLLLLLLFGARGWDVPMILRVLNRDHKRGGGTILLIKDC